MPCAAASPVTLCDEAAAKGMRGRFPAVCDCHFFSLLFMLVVSSSHSWANISS